MSTDRGGRLREEQALAGVQGRYRFKGMDRIRDVALDRTERRAAEKALAEIVAEAQREAAGLAPRRALREGAKTVLEDHLQGFQADLKAKGRNREYVRRLGQRVRNLMKACGWTVARDVTANSFVEWRCSRNGLTPKTLNEYLAAISGLLRWMKGLGRIEENPLGAVGRVDGRGKQSYERRALSPEEVQRLLATSGRRRVVYLTALKTGLRRRELTELEWRDVHLEGEQAYLEVRAAVAKNRRRECLPLDAELVEALRTLQDAGSGRGRVFRVLVPRRETVKKDFERAGITILDEDGRKVDLHALRTTFCTMLAEAGLPERVRQELMRHRDPRLTNQTYTDTSRLPVSAAIAKLPRLLGTDAQIDSQEVVPRRPDVSQQGTEAGGCRLR